MTDLVLDASASVDLLLDTATGRRLQPLLPTGAHWWVPEHFFAEVAGALRRAELRGGVLSARAAQAMTSLSTAPLRRVQVRPLLADAWSKRANLTIADALYVVLAEHLDATLVTTDINLSNAPTLRVATIHP
ncbi:MAG: type II toxin-antitoxin system VapC family toxin [Actinobacteria bacterium]|nr:type II toxin-antitoxin system VapC family toxin [Actinomycetota bacterium]